VALAWGILLIITAAAGPIGPLRQAQANTRIAGSTSNTTTTTTTAIQATLTSSVTSTLSSASAGRPEAATIARPASRPRARASTSAPAGTDSYVVQPGDTLSGIAAALGTPGGWPALYAANRRAVGPDPGLIRPGTVLTLPGPAAPARYTIAAGDTLSGIAAALATPGGWPALYAANRRVIGADPNAIQLGTALAIPRPASSPTSPAHASRPSPPASPAVHPASTPASTPARAPASSQSPARATAPARGPAPAPASGPVSAQAPTSTPTPASASTGGQRRLRSIPALPTGGLPRWLEIVLAAAGLLIATAFLTEPALAIARRRRAGRPAPADEPHIVLADYERLVVTHSRQDGTVYVLRPPGADPHAILLAARLVLAQDRYEELAGHLGVPAHWARE
jgi:LysM repeat protein